MVDTLMIKFIKLYVALGMKPEDIWKFYYEKNRENFKRQKVGGRYEK
jgi:dimeric dUTPase (all-alpha-NTP-PPase superfamily)